MHLHGPALEAAGVTPQLLMRNMRALVRHYMLKAEAAMQEREGGGAAQGGAGAAGARQGSGARDSQWQ